MTLNKSNIQKIYYSMSEVAEMFDVNQSLIRFWEENFDILKPHRNKKGNRLFTPKDIENLRIIYHLVKERGMTLQGAAKQMRSAKGDINREAAIAEKLLEIKSMLSELLIELDDVDNTEVKIEEKPIVVSPSMPQNTSGMIIFNDDDF